MKYLIAYVWEGEVVVTTVSNPEVYGKCLIIMKWPENETV